MNKAEIKIGQTLYYNTTGAYNSKISQICKVVDIGEKFIHILIKGNLGVFPAYESKLSLEPKFKLTNISKQNIQEYIDTKIPDEYLVGKE